MKHPLLKTVIAVLLASCLSYLLFFAFTTASGITGFREETQNASVKLDGITMNIKNIISSSNKLAYDYSERLATDAYLFSIALEDEVRVRGDAAIRDYDKGFVVKKLNSGFRLPEDAEDLPALEAMEYVGEPPVAIESSTPLSGESGVFWSRRPSDPEGSYLLCVYSRLYKDYYFVSYTPDTEIKEYFLSRMNTGKLIQGTQDVYGCLILGVNTVTGQFFYVPAEFKGYSGTDALGISLDGARPDQYRQVKIDGKSYDYAVSDLFYPDGSDIPLRVVIFVPNGQFILRTLEGNIIIAGIAQAIFWVVIIWMISVIHTMRRQTVTETQRKQYSAGRVRMVMVSIGAIGMVLILLVSIISGALSVVYYRSTDCENALQTMESMIDENHRNRESIEDQRETLYLGYAKRISELLTNYPELRTQEKLDEMSEAIDADYLMLFDRNGNEIITNSRYVNLSFGTKESSSTYDFRRLLTGVSSIVHDPCVDEQTGLNRQLIGVSMDGADPSSGYEALIVALEPSDADSAMSDSVIMENLTTSQSIAFSVDRVTGTILDSSNAADIGTSAVDLGMNADDIRSALMDFFKLNNRLWYGRSREFDGAVHYYAVTVDDMYENTFSNSVIYAGLFLAAYVIFALVLMIGYTEKSIDKYGGSVIKDGVWMFRQMEEDKQSARVRRFIDRIINWWRDKTPGARAVWVIELILGVTLILLFAKIFISAAGGNSNGEIAIISYVIFGRWTPGLNLFALTKIVIVILGSTLFILVARAIVGLLNGVLRAKGKTIVQLVNHILNYIVCILSLYLIFKTLGFNTTTLVASVGSLSLAISMASRDIIADILAGIILVFSGEYQIGEIVEIGSFRGWVCNIGIRCTTLVNAEGSVKNVNNRNVNNVVNLSRRDSCVSTQVSIDYNTPLEEVEEMLRRELPELGKTIPQIVKGPTYIGVASMGRGAMTLSIEAECREEDRWAVGSAMNIGLKRMFDRNHIPMRER